MAIESVTCRCARWAAARDVILGKGRNLAQGEVFFGADSFAGGEAFSNQESVGGNAQGRMMIESTSASAFIMTEAEFLFEFLVVTLNAPAHMRLCHQIAQGGVLWQAREVVLEWIGITDGPFDQKPLLRAQATDTGWRARVRRGIIGGRPLPL